jgi:hypothetical protein
MNVRELIAELSKMNGDLEVWSSHPEAGIMWGPIKFVSPSITDRFQPVALIVTDEDGGDDE